MTLAWTWHGTQKSKLQFSRRLVFKRHACACRAAIIRKSRCVLRQPHPNFDFCATRTSVVTSCWGVDLSYFVFYCLFLVCISVFEFYIYSRWHEKWLSKLWTVPWISPYISSYQTAVATIVSSLQNLSLSLSLLPPFLTPRCTFTHTVLVPPHSLFKNNAETACIPSLNHLRVTQALSHVITHHADASVTACFLQTKPAFV